MPEKNHCQRLALAGSSLSHKAVVLLHMPVAITASSKITNEMILILISQQRHSQAERRRFAWSGSTFWAERLL